MKPLNLRTSDTSRFKILCLGAHSDDIEIGCGGTILSILENDVAVDVDWIVFSGDETRSREARRSAEQFLDRVRNCRVVVHGYRDGYLPQQAEHIKDAFEAMKHHGEPDLIFTHYRNDRHQDHRLISDLTWNTFRNHMVLEYEIPKYDGDLGSPNIFHAIREPIYRKKLDIIMTSFESQTTKGWFDPQTFGSLMRLRGMEANSSTKYAEGFYGRKILLDCFSAY